MRATEEERSTFFAQLNARFAALRAEPQVWAEVLAERHALGGAIEDDLD